MMYFLIFVLAVIPFYFFLSHMKTKARRMRATFAMYDARDKFIYLVAEDVISESDPVFEYYYSRINAILLGAPEVGLDHIISGMLKAGAYDHNKAIMKTNLKVRELSDSKSMDIPEVKEAVRGYFEASRAMILSHSSMLKICYLAIRHRERFSRIAGVLAPKEYAAAKIVKDHNDSALNCLDLRPA